MKRLGDLSSRYGSRAWTVRGTVRPLQAGLLGANFSPDRRGRAGWHDRPFCTVRGCDLPTRGGKPWCGHHLLTMSPYVRALLEEIERREAAGERVR